jgi:hypothetical protein
MPDLRLPAYTEAVNMSRTPIPADQIQYVPDPDIPMPDPADIVYLHGSNEPAEIPLARLAAAIETLGLGTDVGSIESIYYAHGAVTVRRYRRDARPSRDEPSTITTTIGVRFA